MIDDYRKWIIKIYNIFKNLVCADPCVQILMDSMDTMSLSVVENTEAVVQTKLKPPWHLLNRTTEKMREIKENFDSYTLSNFQILSHSNVAEEELKKKMKTLINKVKIQKLFILLFLKNLNSTGKLPTV